MALLVTAGWCTQCREAEEAVAGLAEAWQDERRLRVATIDAGLNNLPAPLKSAQLPALFVIGRYPPPLISPG